MKNKTLRATCLMFLLLLPGTLFAWGAEGHQLVCAIAERHLDEDGQRFLKTVMDLGPLPADAGKTFPELCLWADEVRHTTHVGTYETHYINVPRSESRLSLGRDCAALDCIVVGLQRNLTYLARPANGRRETERKAAALRFVGHLVGDLHQPLHAGNLEDRGGNDIQVTFRREKQRLHALWDTSLPAAAGLRYPRSVDELAAQPATDRDKNVLNWMTESFNLARAVAYRNTADRLIGSGDTLGDAYLKRAEPVIRQRLVLAGQRLAWLLNNLGRNELDTNILID